MNCPNCSQAMSVVNFDNQIILHCATCGSSFFEKDGLRRISAASARKLAEDAQDHYVLGNKKVCPKDHVDLVQVENDPSLPKNTVLLRCPTCEGIFAYPDDLLKYKGVHDPSPISALSLKLLPAPKTIFMLSFLAILSFAALLNFGSIARNMSTGSKADEMVKKVMTTTDNTKHYLFFDFFTEAAVTSKVKFIDKTSGTEIMKNVSLEPKTIHHLATSDIDLTHNIYYQIFLGSNTSPTVEKKLTFK